MRQFSAVFLLILHSSFAGIWQTPAVQSFTYEPCTAPYHHPGLLDFIDMKITSTRHNNWRITGRVRVRVPIHSPIQAEIKLERRILGVGVPMLCLDNFGSCTYPDLCDLGAPIDERCPSKLESRGYPCRCPFQAGLYNIPGLVFPFASAVNSHRLFGTHYGKIKISNNGQLLACYDFVTRLS